MNINLINQIRFFGNAITVLYVEDEQNVREQVGKMLQKLFENVAIVANGQLAIELYGQKRFDLVITDLKMPYMDGLQLCEEIIQIHPEQKIILVSAHKEVDEMFRLINIGVVGFISKPIDMDVMLAKIYAVIKNIYAEKMMRYHYDDMKQKLLDNPLIAEEDLYYRDTLTSLYNQDYFLETINNDSKKWAILININDFKFINNHYSFAHGNHLLFQVAQLLRTLAQTYGYELFRFSNDEFVLLKNETPAGCAQMEQEAKNIYMRLEKERYTLIGVENITIGVTMGIASSHKHLLESLYRALMYAKKRGWHYALYSSIEEENVQNIMEVKAFLKESIEKSTVVPVYQPIVMRDGSMKYEVLMRIISSDGVDLVAPSYFLEIAKRHRYYNDISQMVIFKALQEMRHHNHTLSFNFSYIDIKNNSFMKKLEENIKEQGVGERLVFEIVETEHLDNMEIALDFIERFRVYGIKIAIDDFGSGYSNFANIFRIRPDFVKIDGSLVQEMLHNRDIFLFIETIIAFSHRLGIEVIAEFVSSKEIYDAIMSLDIDACQGYFLGKPQEIIADAN